MLAALIVSSVLLFEPSIACSSDDLPKLGSYVAINLSGELAKELVQKSSIRTSDDKIEIQTFGIVTKSRPNGDVTIQLNYRDRTQAPYHLTVTTNVKSNSIQKKLHTRPSDGRQTLELIGITNAKIEKWILETESRQ